MSDLRADCLRCGWRLTPCDCGIWWCPGAKHAMNRPDGRGSHFCWLGTMLIAVPFRESTGA